jgi:hypothetical protein
MNTDWKSVVEGAYSASLIDSYQMHFLLAALSDEFALVDPEEFFKRAMEKEPRITDNNK